MRACRLRITNFRGIQSAKLLLPKHGVLIGDNNTGKTTIFEALDLVLGVRHDLFEPRRSYPAQTATRTNKDCRTRADF
jgi:predicted ATP-dependent endonuclease of OLD family